MADFVNVKDIEAELTVLGVRVAEFLALARIHRATWGRLRAGKFAPRQDTALRIAHAMKMLRARAQAKPVAKKKTEGAAA